MNSIFGKARAILSGGSIALLAACVNPIVVDEQGRTDVAVSRAASPSAVIRHKASNDALACIKQTGRLHGKVFSVGSFADSTGKINSVAIGATGNFLPQGGSAAFITDALRRAGADVVSTYFGTPRRRVHSHYAINGIFNSLDFGKSASIDARIEGVGPITAGGWAQLSLTIQLDEADTRRNRQMSIIQRPIRYQQFGVGVSRVFGTSLATGIAFGEEQQKLQLEALNGPIALGVADVLMREFPDLASRCGKGVAPLLDSEASET